MAAAVIAKPGQWSRLQSAARALVARVFVSGAGHQRLYAAAQINRLTDSFRATRDEIHHELRRDLDALRHRSRDLENNNDFAARYLEMCETNIIGDQVPRLVSQAKLPNGTPDTVARAAIQESFAEWCQRGHCEISGTLSFVEICWNIVRGTPRDGEFLIAEHPGEGPHGYQLQIIDVDLIDTRMNREPSEGVNAIRLGVEINKFGKPVTYWLKQRAQDASSQPFPADTLIHRFRTRRAGQTRGVPWMHAAMLSMHYSGEFALSALLAAKHGADHYGYFVSPDGSAPPIGVGAAPGTEGDDGSSITVSQPGMYDTLPAGYDFKQVDSKYPNEVFDPFMRAATRRMSSGLNVSYPALSNDHSSLNYNSIRATQSDDRDQWRKHQRWFVESWASFIFNRWLRFALASGAVRTATGQSLSIANLPRYSKATWQCRGWASADPLKDTNADIANIDAGLDSATAVVARRGRSLEEVLGERAAEIELADSKDVPINLGNKGGGTPPAEPPQPPDGQTAD